MSLAVFFAMVSSIGCAPQLRTPASVVLQNLSAEVDIEDDSSSDSDSDSQEPAEPAATPEPTPEPTPEATPTPTPEPTPEATPTPSFTLLRSFVSEESARLPRSELVQYGDFLYGTSAAGGSKGVGTIFRIKPDGSDFAVILNFGSSGIAGTGPRAGLIVLNDKLFGMTNAGGTSSGGVIFRVDPDGSNYTVLHNFSTATGRWPLGVLLHDSGYLYGTTSSGGSSGFGCVFKINLDGSGYSVLHHFNGTNGRAPFPGLAISGSTLFGVTDQGGANSSGVIFKIDTDGSNFALLKEFAFSDGSTPRGQLLIDNGTIYGTTSAGQGGSRLFKMSIDGSGYTNLRTFSNSEASSMYAGLIKVGSYLYGTSFYGGSSGQGSVYRIDTDGNNFSLMHSFTAAHGVNPYSKLLLVGSTLFGTFHTASTDNPEGGIFKIDTDASDFEVVKDFDLSMPRNATASLVESGGLLYGTTGNGGKFSGGTLYSVEPDGENLTLVHEFGSSAISGEGSSPVTAVVISGDWIFGTTYSGGTNGSGIIYKINKNGTNYSVLHSFAASSNPVSNRESLIEVSGVLYGVTGNGGTESKGSVFKINTDGTGFETLHSFTESIGWEPTSKLIYSEGKLYGTTRFGDSNQSNSGIIYRLDIDGSNFEVLHSFSATDGSYPIGLQLSGNRLYGITVIGGANSFGTAYSLSKDGSDFELIHSFSDEIINPYSDAILVGDQLYGLAKDSDNNQIAYSLKIDGSEPPQLIYEFGSSNGQSDSPYDIMYYNGQLFGATYYGGLSDSGYLFSIDLE